jgi:hypothetical protein
MAWIVAVRASNPGDRKPLKKGLIEAFTVLALTFNQQVRSSAESGSWFEGHFGLPSGQDLQPSLAEAHRLHGVPKAPAISARPSPFMMTSQPSHACSNARPIPNAASSVQGLSST